MLKGVLVSLDFQSLCVVNYSTSCNVQEATHSRLINNSSTLTNICTTEVFENICNVNSSCSTSVQVLACYAITCTNNDLLSIGTVEANISETLQWRNNESDGVSNHRCLDCLLNRLFRRRSKKTWKFRVTGLSEGNPPMSTGDRWIPLTKGQ